MKPLIAITPRFTTFIHPNDTYGSKDEYLTAITKAGGIPCIVAYDNVEEIAEIFEGLLVIGGEDVDPKYYHADTNPLTKPGKKEMDEGDSCLIHAFNRLNKPIFGICRGIQIINVAFGGTLIQDIPSILNEEHNQLNNHLDRHSFAHEIEITPHTHLKEIMKEETKVNSYHHQSLDKVADGFMVSAKCNQVIEAIEKENILAVQWHPAITIDNEASFNLFQDFINRCKK